MGKTAFSFVADDMAAAIGTIDYQPRQCAGLSFFCGQDQQLRRRSWPQPRHRAAVLPFASRYLLSLCLAV